MKRQILTAIFAVGMTSVAYADGPAADWRGFYYGTHIGGFWGDADLSDFDDPSYSESFDGGIAGGQVGYNWQSANLVFGIEGDYSVVTADEGLTRADLERVGVDWRATLRARLGYAFDRHLLYGTAGLAAGRIELDDDTDIGKETAIGWTIGGGLETKLTPKLSARVEYLYSDFGNENSYVSGDDVSADVTAHTLTVGFNYSLGDNPMSVLTYEPSAAAPGWAGAHFGGYTAWAWADGDHDEIDGGSDGGFDFNGSVSGIQAGYDWQRGNFVYGIEADIGLSDAEDRGEALDSKLDLERVGMDWLSTLRARAGYDFGSYLVYATGGAAFAGIDLYDNGDNETKAMTGWTLGVGVEAKVTANNTIKIEYLHADFGDETFDVEGDERNVDLDADIIRIGGNHRF